MYHSGLENQLPGLDTKRTNSKVVSETLPYHYKYCQKTKTLVRGLKPKFVPKNVVVSKKAMKHYLHVEVYENPIQKALEYKKLMDEKFGGKIRGTPYLIIPFLVPVSSFLNPFRVKKGTLFD